MSVLVQFVYGSETGTAQDIATSLHRHVQYYCGTNSNIRLSTFDQFLMAKPCVLIFICSTCGQGDPPKNMDKFWKYLMSKKAPEDLFYDVTFCALGLGDSSYTKFNFVAKKLFRRLVMLKGQPLFDLQLADEQHELGSDYQSEIFKSDCLKILSQRLYFDLNKPIIKLSEPLPCSVNLKFVEEFCTGTSMQWHHDCNHVGFVNQVTRVTDAQHFQNTILVQINFDSKYSSRLKPGDVLAVQPRNSIETLELFFQIFKHLSKDSIVFIDEISDVALSIEFLVLNVLDLCSIPRKSFFEEFSKLSPDVDECEKLEEMQKDTELYYAYCSRPRRSVLEVFQDFPKSSGNLSLERIVELVPRIKSRKFSVASIPQPCEEESSFCFVELLIAVVNYKTKLHKPRLGLCSNFLLNCQKNETIMIDFRSGSFKLPPLNQVPLIMIGPGTGVAPFRSFIQSRKGENCYLFFGCRHPDKDYYFKHEWLEIYPLLKVFPIFSRLQERNPENVYVQHSLRANGDLFWKLVSKLGAYIYLAGTSKYMPKDVKEIIKFIIMKFGDMDTEGARQYFNNLITQGRFQEETW